MLQPELTPYACMQAVIFMFGHDDHGSCGLILNRPTQHNIGKLAGANRLCPEFSQNELYLGGDVGVDAVHMLHGHAQLPGSQKVVNGIHIGGFEAARTMVREGNMDPHSIRCGKVRPCQPFHCFFLRRGCIGYRHTVAAVYL